MSMKELQKELGKPDDIEEYTYSKDEISKTFYYDELGLDFTFESQDNDRLSYISVSSEEFHIANKIRVGTSRESVVQFISELKLSDPEIEDASSVDLPTHELFLFEDENLHLWFDNNEITEIQFGPFWEDSKTVIWEE